MQGSTAYHPPVRARGLHNPDRMPASSGPERREGGGRSLSSLPLPRGVMDGWIPGRSLA